MTDSTLRDDILNHRCPICGTTMEKRPPERRVSTFRWVVHFVILFVFTMVALSTASHQHWSEAAFFMAFAVFSEVTGP